MNNWRQYRYMTRNRVNRGLADANLDELKKPIADEQGIGNRRFGTELTRNVFNNHRAQPFENRKRTFKQLNSEQKEEENNSNADEFEKPAKKPRYNLRSRNHRIETTVSTEILGKENQAKYGKPALQKNKTMDVDSEESYDEDIDLILHKQQQQQQNQQKQRQQRQRKVRKQKKEIKVPLRRSLRLKNKRERKLRAENERKKKKQENKGKGKKQIAIEYIVDDELLECDKVNIDNDLFVTEYISDITNWYLECEETEEQKGLIRNNYISGSFQPDLSDSMRYILLDWLFNVHRKFKLRDSTLFLGVYIMDSYLSLVPIKRNELQLIGSCSIWIASKYHEIYAPEANDFVYISNYAFDRDILFETEIKILTALKFKFANIITPLHFIQRYLQIATYPLWKKYKQRGTAKAIRDGQHYIELVKDLTIYFAELSLFDCKLISMQKPSIIAAACLCFAILSISMYSKWPEFLQRETNYKYKDLKPILVRLDNMRKYSNVKLTSVRKKHKQNHQWIDRPNIDLVINNPHQ